MTKMNFRIWLRWTVRTPSTVWVIILVAQQCSEGRLSLRCWQYFDQLQGLVVVQCTDEFLKARLYGRCLLLVMHADFDKLCKPRYETLLYHNAINDRFHEHGRIDTVAQQRLRLKVQLTTTDQSRYQDINKAISDLFLFRNRGVFWRLKGVYKALLDSSQNDSSRRSASWSSIFVYLFPV